MKRTMMMSVVAMLLVVAMASVATAAVYTYRPVDSDGDDDLRDLDHYKAYLWGLQPDIAPGETIVSANLYFHRIRNWNSSSNDLYLTLMDTATLGVTEYSDNQATPNYFAAPAFAPYEEIAHYEDLPSTSQDLTYNFTAAQVNLLKTYVADNNIGLGFDPDCHFYNCYVELTITTREGGGEPPIPEPAGIALFLGGLGASVLRRKRR